MKLLDTVVSGASKLPCFLISSSSARSTGMFLNSSFFFELLIYSALHAKFKISDDDNLVLEEISS